MSSQNDLDMIVRRLNACNYQVFPEQEGFDVRHVTDKADVSHAANLNELAELADLFEWRKQRQASQAAT